MQGDFMKLFYSPHYTGHVYTGLENAENGILFDTETVSTQGLLDRIKLHAGIRRRIKPQGERFVAYYKAMAAYMKDKRESVFRESFNTDPLKTAEQCLAWRDALAAAGWNSGTQAQSARLTALQGIEKHFTGGKDGKKENISLAEEIFAITEEIKAGCPLPQNLEIQMPFDWNILPPAEKGLLQALQDRNVKITLMPRREDKGTNLDRITALLEGKNESSSNGKNAEREITLAENDDTFKIWHFADRTESMKYLSTLPADSFNVWINENNQELDSWLKLAGKPAAGSNISGLPQIAQLLVIGISLFSRPLNIYRLMDWLNMPSSPLPRKLCGKLADKIAATGGYYNDECKKVIDEFLNYDYSDRDIEEKESKEKISKNKDRVDNFLYFFEKSQNEKNEIEISKVINFVINLNDKLNPYEKAQLVFVKDQCAAMQDILSAETSETIEYKKIESMLGSINSAVEMPLYPAEENCHNVIDSFGKMAASSHKTICCGFYDKTEEKLRYSFLYEEEKKELELNFWKEADERQFNRILMLMPFVYSEQLTLVTADKNGTENTKKHPVIIRLESQIKEECFKHIVIEQQDGQIQQPEEKDIVDNSLAADDSYVKIKEGIIKPRTKESATSLEKLIQNPLDYVFKYLAKIKPEGIAAINDISLTKGTVAHAVIKAIFEPSENEPGKGTEEYINANFEKIFNEQLEQCVAILLLPENHFEKELLRNQLKKSLGLLRKTFEDNNLKVKYCEKEYVQENMLKDAKAQGIADMILEDNSGNIYLFDFKWTGNDNKYGDIIRENRSVQLALYSALIKQSENKDIKAAAYVLLPKATIITPGENLKGQNVIHINDAKDLENVFETVRNSYKYRMDQFEKGILEIADGLADFDYFNDTEKENLVPLERDKDNKNIKKQDKYSDYLCFKTRKGEAK